MDIEKLLSEMTIEEKAALCQGADAWHTVAVERVGVPEVCVSDGPHGLRKVNRDGVTVKAVCFPTAVGTAASFSRELLEELGGAIGDACREEDVHVILGPAANIKRTPLCGRNFEYFSEDPYLSGETAAAFIRGVQRKGVGTSLKHYAMNNQETRRLTVSAEVDERAEREIYLTSFERAVKGGKPWTVMCSYNKVNGVYSSENERLQEQVLRREWGFDGMVMTDWGACNDHVKGVASGVELEMPRSGDDSDRLLVEAVKSGRLSEETLTEAARRVLRLAQRVYAAEGKPEDFDLGVQHHQARKYAREAMVLLKNDGAVLPIRGNRKVAFIGQFAEKPRYQGGGSSHINVTEELSALEAVRSVCPVTYAQGFDMETDSVDAAMEAEAVRLAGEADVAVLFIGLPERIESEGYDRADMKLPPNQNHLVSAVAAVQPNTVVVLHNGSPVEMPWLNEVPAILEAYLGGQAGGGAVVDLLFGAVSPSAKLAETFPLRLEDTPSYLNFPGDKQKVRYAESIWVGYRYYDKKNMAVAFPFGHGLTYTTFQYGNLRLSSPVFSGEKITASVDVTNTGSFPAAEVVQFYIRPDHAGKERPVRELKGYGKIFLNPGETGTVTAELDARSFAYWEEEIHDWYAEPGLYQVEAAASSRDIRLCAPVEVALPARKVTLNGDSLVRDALQIPGALELIEETRRRYGQGVMTDEQWQGFRRWFHDTPLHGLVTSLGLSREKTGWFVQELMNLQK